MQVYETTVNFMKPTILNSTIDRIYDDFTKAFTGELSVRRYMGDLLKISGMLSFGGMIQMLNILELHGIVAKDVSIQINEPRYY